MTSVNVLIGQLDQNDEVLFFPQPMSLLIYYNSHEEPSSPVPTDIFKALETATSTIL